MSTKFRQSFVRLFSACRNPSKEPRSSAVLFCKEYAMRPTLLMGMNRAGADGTISTTAYHPQNMSQIHERRLLLADNTPTPVTAPPLETTKFLFPE